MKKQAFLTMMIQDVSAMPDNKKRNLAEIIDCMEIALSQTGESTDIDPHKNAEEACALIEKYAKEEFDKDRSIKFIGPFEAAEKVLAPYLGVTYVRTSRKVDSLIDLNDFI